MDTVTIAQLKKCNDFDQLIKLLLLSSGLNGKEIETIIKNCGGEIECVKKSIVFLIKQKQEAAFKKTPKEIDRNKKNSGPELN